MLKLYGIKNCDTVKKALKLLNKNGIEYNFIDFKKAPPTPTHIKKWKKAFGDWPINKRGTTYRKIKDEWETANDANKLTLIVSNPSMIKRPIGEFDSGEITFGIDGLA